MRLTVRSKVNAMEFITLRCAFSIYTGWVTAATILNATFFLKSIGLEGTYEYEGTWTVIILWVALCVYILASFMERNPVYASVFIWVLVAIRKNHGDITNIKMYSEQVVNNALIIIIIHAIWVALLTGYCF